MEVPTPALDHEEWIWNDDGCDVADADNLEYIELISFHSNV